MKKKTVFLLALLFFLSFNHKFREGIAASTWEKHQDKIYCSGDSHVFEDDPSSNFGGQLMLRVGDSTGGGYYESYIFFNVANEDYFSNITSIVFNFTVFVASDNFNISMYLAENNWEEDTINWNTKPATTMFLGNVSIMKDEDLYEDDIRYGLNITEHVLGKKNFTLAMKASTVQETMQGASSEYSLLPPRLDVIYWKEIIEDEGDDNGDDGENDDEGGGGGGGGDSSPPSTTTPPTQKSNVEVIFIPGYRTEVIFGIIGIYLIVSCVIFKKKGDELRWKES